MSWASLWTSCPLARASAISSAEGLCFWRDACFSNASKLIFTPENEDPGFLEDTREEGVSPAQPFPQLARPQGDRVHLAAQIAGHRLDRGHQVPQAHLPDHHQVHVALRHCLSPGQGAKHKGNLDAVRKTLQRSPQCLCQADGLEQSSRY